jgi:redox-sensing transcriptional repressor
VISRVSLYLRQLETLQRLGHKTISSSQLGAALGLNDAQVRKDLAYFGPFGHPGIGYQIEELVPILRGILGIDRVWPTALIGLGNLGRALLRYRGFRARGFHVVALFDNDPKKVGQSFAGLTVRPLASLPPAATELGLRLAILTVPAEAAQAVADLATSAGIRGILNFAPATLNLPDSTALVSVDLSTQLEHLAYKVLTGRSSPIPPAD